DPVDAGAAGQVAFVGDGRFRLFDAVELFAKIQEHLPRVAGADLAGVTQAQLRSLTLPARLVVADEQGPQADAGALGVGEAGDDELLPADTLQFHPGVTTAGQVNAVPSLANDSFFAAPAGVTEFGGTFARVGFRPAHAIGPADGGTEQLLPL